MTNNNHSTHGAPLYPYTFATVPLYSYTDTRGPLAFTRFRFATFFYISRHWKPHEQFRSSPPD